MRLLLLATTCAFAFTASAYAQEDDADHLARQLVNPISSLVSVPLQMNADFGAGADGDGSIYTLNIQPVIPLRLNHDWNLISRTILPIAGREDLIPGDDSLWGIGDTTQSFFLSPEKPSPGGLIWGVGAVFLLPTATDDALGTEKWGVGPTFVGLTQRGRWTIGVLANHVWSVAGEEDRADVNATFVQPFAAYALGHGQSLSFNTEATYDWESEQWNVPINVSYARVFAIQHQRMNLGIGLRYFAETPDNGPDWGVRTTLTFLFPRR